MRKFQVNSRHIKWVLKLLTKIAKRAFDFDGDGKVESWEMSLAVLKSVSQGKISQSDFDKIVKIVEASFVKGD